MTKSNMSYDQYKYYGAGSRPNEKVLKCYTCRNRGWPHEPIVLAKATGGRYLKIDYYSGKPHLHKDRKAEAEGRN